MKDKATQLQRLWDEIHAPREPDHDRLRYITDEMSSEEAREYEESFGSLTEFREELKEDRERLSLARKLTGIAAEEEDIGSDVAGVANTIVPVMFRCEEFALGLAAYDRTPAEFQIGDFSLHITCQNTPEKELVVFATAVWNRTDTAIPAAPQTLQLSHKGSVLGSIMEWSPGLGEGRWVGNAVIPKSARIGIVKTDEFEAAFL